MIEIRKKGQSAVAAALVCFAAGFALAGASGQVVDRAFLPLAGAQACYVNENGTGKCAETDADGFYTLPDSKMKVVRISLAGYLPVHVAAIHQDRPVQLERAAAFIVMVLDDASSRPIGEGSIWVIRTSGERSGPFPVAQGGTRVNSFPPGPIALEVEAEGYRQKEPVRADLESGYVTQVEVRLIPAK